VFAIQTLSLVNFLAFIGRRSSVPNTSTGSPDLEGTLCSHNWQVGNAMLTLDQTHVAFVNGLALFPVTSAIGHRDGRAASGERVISTGGDADQKGAVDSPAGKCVR
jgi:hypothetical protein